MSGMRLWFHRDFTGYTGGHGKVWDYFNHALALGLDARVYLTAGSLRDASNPWMTVPGRIEPEWRPERADALFLAGMDWAALPIDGPGADRPVLNLIQGMRHARVDPALPLRGFLWRPAHRICVSQAVAEAIRGTGEVRGPVTVIPAALDPGDVRRLAGLPAPTPRPAAGPVFIGAAKAPELGREVAAILEAAGVTVELAEDGLPRREFLARMAAARLVVLLPLAEEGFFLPGLEAMVLERPVVMPGCVGNGEYARDGVNCLMPPPDAAAIAGAVRELQADVALAEAMVAAGRQAAQRHAPEAERHAFADVLQSWLPA